ncbi:MAG: YopX family protein [Eubacteriales bacterium]|nr:YopX family protein [Eubacteriales bacterium]
MNREILFKAKRKDNGEWVEGGYFSEPNTDNKYIICWNSFGLGFNEFIEVDPDTICQYTGLTDKNGKKIWENDILIGRGNDRDLSKVVFGKFHVIDAETLRRVDRVIGWHTEVIETDALSKCEPFCLPTPLTDFYIERSKLEAYGNIFDNPELMEVE